LSYGWRDRTVTLWPVLPWDQGHNFGIWWRPAG